MFTRTKAALCLAACAAVMGGTTTARAAEPVDQPQSQPQQPSQFHAMPLMLDDQTPVNQRLIDEGLGRAGVGTYLKDWGIKAGGYVEGSYNYNFTHPDGSHGISEGRVFDFEQDAGRLNQLALQIARTPDVAADAKAGKWDVGFGVDMMYGSDGRIVHSNGLSGYTRFSSPINQFDLTQAYVDIVAPIGNGLDVRVGKFVTTMGYETIAPIATVTGSSGNSLYSHSFQFGFGIPFTQTGVIANYALNSQWSVLGGITRGWDESTNDNNGAVDFVGQVKYVPNADWSFTLNSSVGPQMFHDDGDYRYLFEGIAQYAPKGSKWSFAADATFAWEEHASLTGDTARWYGVAGYASYAVCDYATVNARGEWFRDDGGSRLGVNASFYEVTLGMKIIPFPHDKLLANFIVRPEVRGDFCNKDAFNGGSDRTQGTVAVDAIFAL
jgi:hypothetical protein